MAKQNKSKTTQRSSKQLGATGGVQKQSKTAIANAAYQAKLASLIAAQPPNICVAPQWGKALLEDGLPFKLHLHGLFGNNIVKHPKKLKFDPTFNGNDDIKYRLMASWYNARKNNIVDPKIRHRAHHHRHWSGQGRKHADEVRKSINEYYIFTLGIFERMEKTVNTLLRESVGRCFGTVGSRRLMVDTFLAKLEQKSMYATIHACQGSRKMKRGEEEKQYQTLKEVHFYLDPADTNIYIKPPCYPEGTTQGDYNPNLHMYLV